LLPARPADGREHGIQHRQLLLFAQAAASPVVPQTIRPSTPFPADQSAQSDEIDGTVVERRDQWNPDTLKR
jgi:hypothetical protein